MPNHSPNLESGEKSANIDLLHPQWETIEKHFGAIVPPILKSYYLDHEKILQRDFDVLSTKTQLGEPIYVESFCPINDISLLGAFDDMERFFPFAQGLGGEEFVIDITEDDPTVWYHQYDIGLAPECLQNTGLKPPEFLAAETAPSKRMQNKDWDG